MIVYGSGGGNSVLGDAGTHECPECKQTSAFTAICNYEYWHIWYLCSLVTKRDFYIMCNSCQTCTPIDKAAVKQQFPRDNIPFMRKRGWMLVAGLVAAILIVGAIGSSRDHSERMEKVMSAVATPRLNDVYHVNLAYVENSGFGPEVVANRKAWGAFKLVEMDGDDMFFATSTRAWEEYKGLTQAFRTNSIQYDMKDLVYLTKSKLATLHKNNLIQDVDRK